MTIARGNRRRRTADLVGGGAGRAPKTAGRRVRRRGSVGRRGAAGRGSSATGACRSSAISTDAIHENVVASPGARAATEAVATRSPWTSARTRHAWGRQAQPPHGLPFVVAAGGGRTHVCAGLGALVADHVLEADEEPSLRGPYDGRGNVVRVRARPPRSAVPPEHDRERRADERGDAIRPGHGEVGRTVHSLQTVRRLGRPRWRRRARGLPDRARRGGARGPCTTATLNRRPLLPAEEVPMSGSIRPFRCGEVEGHPVDLFGPAVKVGATSARRRGRRRLARAREGGRPGRQGPHLLHGPVARHGRSATSRRGASTRRRASSPASRSRRSAWTFPWRRSAGAARRA